MKDIQIKTLEGINIETLARSWDKAFSDYAVKIQMDPDTLSAVMRQNDVRFDASIGAFDGDLLVGFWMNGLRKVDGVLTAYDAGTAIWPEYRAGGISKRLSALSNEVLKSIGVKAYLLEVLSDNERAFNIYKKDGFEVTRSFVCFKRSTPLETSSDDSSFIFSESHPERNDLEKLPRMEYEPSWQNGNDAVAAINDRLNLVVARKDDEVMGYIIVQPERGRVFQFAIRHDLHETELANLLLHHASVAIPDGAELAFINVDEKAEKTINLIKSNGFSEFARQYEMQKVLQI